MKTTARIKTKAIKKFTAKRADPKSTGGLRTLGVDFTGEQVHAVLEYCDPSALREKPLTRREVLAIVRWRFFKQGFEGIDRLRNLLQQNLACRACRKCGQVNHTIFDPMNFRATIPPRFCSKCATRLNAKRDFMRVRDCFTAELIERCKDPDAPAHVPYVPGMKLWRDAAFKKVRA
jgi:hypothetical protein